MTATIKSNERPSKHAPRARKRFARMARMPEVTGMNAEKAATELKAVEEQPERRTTKADIFIDLLSRPEGATIEQMMTATGWQAHSVRGFLAGTVKKKPGVELRSVRSGDLRVYSITAREGDA